MKTAKRQESTQRAPLRPVSDCAGLRRIRSEDLFADTTCVLIDHQDSTYRLQITNQGKLLLTK